MAKNDGKSRRRMLEKYYRDNLQEPREKDLISVVEIESKLTTFYKQQGMTIEMFDKTANTRKEDIKRVLERVGVILV
tara:strand:+ start:264 stop:494 length:231 start_codon:yes stop_codon:yes gene_type:complete